MRKPTQIAGTIGLVAASYLAGIVTQSNPAEASPKKDLFYVQRAVDGDTLIGYFVARVEHEVRLLSVDTPERGKPYFKEATQETADMVEGKVVALEFEADMYKRDKYGRLLAYVYAPDGTNLNLDLVQKGLSPYYDKYGPGLYPDEFTKAAKEAADKKLGLWEDAE